MELNDDTFLLYAVKEYNNPSCVGIKDFYDDLKRFKYIKRLLRKYKKTGKISERLMLNHLILLHNVFGESILPLLFYKIEKEHWSQLKTFLVYLSYLPDGYRINNQVEESILPLDENIIQSLRNI